VEVLGVIGVVVLKKDRFLSSKIKSRYSYESQLQYAFNRSSFVRVVCFLPS
jgi:hypothetical protein